MTVLLLLRRRVATPVEVIVDRLWTEPPADSANAVHRVVSYLRRALGPEGSALLVTQASGYALLVDDDAVDAARFERLVHRALAVDAAAPAGGQALNDIDTALGLWRGEPLADVAHHEWAAAEVTRLDEVYLQAREARLAALLALGRPHEAVTEARALVATHPLRERLHAQLMVALYRTGRQGEALQAYVTARHRLAQELGLDPGPELQQLERRILAHDEGLHAAAAPPEPPRPDPPASPPAAAQPAWPAAPTSLVGRKKDLDDLGDLLARTRLLTLTGPGGAGKTRLACELSSLHAAQVNWFVDLSVVGSDDLVAPTVARAVGSPVTPGHDVVEAIISRIGTSRGLLVLDNCEHVVDAAGALASRLLRGCPDLVQVTTSRRPLRVAGEVTWPVLPLRLPPPGVATQREVADSPAAQLFAARAAAVRPGLTITDANAADVAAIVRSLDGLPLAIELAAAHADVLTVSAIRRRLADHFELLETEVRDTPVRQRTLRAVIDSSVNLLTDAERRCFIQLGVFAGSFDLEAAAAVTACAASDGYRLTASLVRQSLVVPTATGRYRLLESLRAYAAQALTADAADHDVRGRHLDHLIDLMTAADRQIRTDAQEEWLVRIRETVPDLRAALGWSLGGAAPDRGALLAAASAWYWTLEGMLVEARQWLDAAEAVPALDDRVRAALRLGAGRIAAPLGDLIGARTACTESVEISRRTGDDAMIGAALVTLGIAQWALGDLAGAAASHDEAVGRLATVGDTWNRTAALVLRSRTAIDAGDERTDERIDTAIAAARQEREKHLIGLAVSQRARRALLLEDAQAAYDSAQECLAVWRQVGYQEGEIAALNLLGRASTALNRTDQAEEFLRESLRTAAGIHHRGALCEGLECLAAVFHATGRDEQALLLLAVAERERRHSDMPTPAADAGQLADLSRRVRDRLGAPMNSALAGVRFLTVDGLLDQLGVKR
ncbi:MAG TPA: BTAD domain-containing putative transcriptional regulator [Micromonosporaceae bacterium]|nr:BTAD domain-containing putative transcriptional regulator [Micromonosporaceae bacterium]